MYAVKNSQIVEIGHDGDNILIVRFRHGGPLHRYYGVTADDFAKILQKAESLEVRLCKCTKGNFKFLKLADVLCDRS